MSDNEMPIQQWWPNYPNPVQMYLCWEHDNTYRLLYNENEIRRCCSLSSDVVLPGARPRSTEAVHHRTTSSASASVADRFSTPSIFNETQNNSAALREEDTQTRNEVPGVPCPIQTFHRSNEKILENNHRKNKKMRPYKKRSFHSNLQSTENNMEGENSEDSEKQVSSSPPLEEVEKDKDKEGETKRRKKWKRKISRKQFRHHDIKLFTPGEYRSTTLLKHKDSSSTIPKKNDVSAKESITDLIVTTLGGQKQGSPQKAGRMEEAADSTTKNDAEENNNTNGVQNNNNNIGKHNLPAIIMETPSIRRTSVDNTNMPKSNFKILDTKFTRRMSVDMPVLNAVDQIPEHPKTQSQATDIGQAQTSVQYNEANTNGKVPKHTIKVSRKHFSHMESNGHYTETELGPEKEIHNSNHKKLGPNHITQEHNRIPKEQSRLVQQVHYNGHVDHNHKRLPQENLEPMETFTEEPPAEPENLSLKRRHSGENPVDLSKRSVETVDQQQNHYHQQSHRHAETTHLSTETGKNTDNLYSSSNYHHHHTDGNVPVVVSSSQNTSEYVRNNVPNYTSTSPKVHPTITYSKESDSRNQDQAIMADTVVKITNLNMWQEVLQRLLKQSFTLQILDLMAHAYEQIDQAQNENCIHPDLKFKAQKLLSEAYSFISLKLKMLNLDVNPIFVIKILGQSDYTPEKNTLRHYMENIERIRNLAIEEAAPVAPKTSQFPLPPGYLQNYREVRRSPPAPYLTHINKLQYNRNSRDSHLPGGPSYQSANHSSTLVHQGGQSSRAGGNNMPPGYLRGASPKTGNHPISGGYSRETSPRTGDHPLPMESSTIIGDYSIHQRRSRGPSPQTSEHPVSSGLSQRIGDYPFTQGLPGGPSPNTRDHPMPYGYHGEPLASAGEYSTSHGNSRGASPRNGDHQLLLGYTGGAFLRTGGELMQQALPQKSVQRSVPLELTREPLVTGAHFMPTGYPERHPARSLPLNYPKDLQFQHPDSYNTPYNIPNNFNINHQPNQFVTPTGHKESMTRSSGVVGRPRSKSHRTTDTRSEQQQRLRRSLSNPHHAAVENPFQPHLDETMSRMPPPMVPTSTHNLHTAVQANNNRPPPIPNLAQNKELSITSSTAALSKPNVPTLYSDVFYHNLHNHVTKGNPLAISVHPQSRSNRKNVSGTQRNIHAIENNERQKRSPNIREMHHTVPEEHTVPKEPSVPLLTSPVDESITSSTDRLEISKVTNVSKQSIYEKVSLSDPVSTKPTETLKSIPVAVIVADKSMQITKERTATSDKGTSIDIPEETDARISVSSISNENISSSKENLSQAFDKEQEENNTEFLVWLEKLKSNEKLKSRFLSQMGIIKKEEPHFTSGSDPIEIVDSDEEESLEPQRDQEAAHKSTENALKVPSNQTQSPLREDTIKIQTSPNSTENYVSFEVPIQAKSSTITSSNSMEVDKIPSTPKHLEIRNSSPKQSLSKKGYIPPIPLPYIPISNGQTLINSPNSIKKSKKDIYSPEIEPISPVGNEATFVFPEVASGPKLLPPLNVNARTNATPDSVTSPTYHKRKNPLEFPGGQGDQTQSTQSPNDNVVKRRKSLDRPQATRSPRIAPSGKLCYVRESHMFLRYFDDTQVELFISSLSTQDEELLRSTGIEPERFKSTKQPSKFGQDQRAKTEKIHLPRDVEFSEKEDIPEVEEFIKETSLVEQFVPKDFADFYRYVTGFQIIKNKHPVSLQTFLTMYNTNRTSELLRKYLERDEVVSRK